MNQSPQPVKSSHLLTTSRRLAVLLVAILVTSLITTAGHSQGSVAQLKRQLAQGKDWRVRVHAALQLGKKQHHSVRPALERALSDQSASVRASAVAALQAYGDQRALPALRKLHDDPSDNVRHQAALAIRALQAQRQGSEYVVQVGDVRVHERVPAKSLKRYVRRVAHKNLRRVPGVVMKPEASKHSQSLPQLQFDGTLRKLDERRQGRRYEVSAQVEFVISQMPDRLIKGRMSGAATVHADASASKHRAELERLRREAVEAATESALSNAEQALRAATNE